MSEENVSHAKAQRCKETLRNAAALCIFALLREKSSRPEVVQTYLDLLRRLLLCSAKYLTAVSQAA
jgi:hypothetical protein